MAGLAKAPHNRLCDVVCWIRRFESSWSPCPCWRTQTVIGKVGIPACDSQATDKFAYANEYYRQSHTQTKPNTTDLYANTIHPLLSECYGVYGGIMREDWPGRPPPS